MTLPSGIRRICASAVAALAFIGALVFARAGVAQDHTKGTKPAPAAAEQTQQQAQQVPNPEVLLVMIRSALIGLDHANRTGNYSVLREMGGPALQRLSTAQLADAFANLRAAKVDLLVAAIATPQLTQQPTMSPQGDMLQLVGYFPTQPRRLQFNMVYQAAGGQWRLAGLNVGLVDVNAKAETKSDGKEAAPAPKAKTLTKK